MNVELGNLWELIDKGGTIALAFLAIVSFLRGWVVPRWVYLELKERCTQISSLADRATELAERQTKAVDELRKRRRTQDDHP